MMASAPGFIRARLIFSRYPCSSGVGSPMRYWLAEAGTNITRASEGAEFWEAISETAGGGAATGEIAGTGVCAEAANRPATKTTTDARSALDAAKWRAAVIKFTAELATRLPD